MCYNWTCPGNMWKCMDNKTCISHYNIMNGKLDCPDKSDEIEKYHAGQECLDTDYQCDIQVTKNSYSTSMMPKYGYFGLVMLEDCYNVNILQFIISI